MREEKLPSQTILSLSVSGGQWDGGHFQCSSVETALSASPAPLVATQRWFFDLASFFLSLALLDDAWKPGKTLAGSLTMLLIALYYRAPVHPLTCLILHLAHFALAEGLQTAPPYTWDVFIPDLCMTFSFLLIRLQSLERTSFNPQPKLTPNSFSAPLSHVYSFFIILFHISSIHYSFSVLFISWHVLLSKIIFIIHLCYLLPQLECNSSESGNVGL